MHKVILAGAGIGSAKNITLAVREALEQCDVIVYDRLINKHILDDFAHKELIYVGKSAAQHAVSQEGIHAILAEEAGKGKKVVRLKGGDPYVFGRGSEEALYLKERNIPFEVLPGVTSGVAVLATAGIPATHRNIATSISFITGHLSDEGTGDFEIYGKLKGTLVFYMGLNNLEKIVKGLLQGGMPKDTKISVIMNGAWPSQRSMDSTLEHVLEDIRPLVFSSPALIVVGKVIGLREELNFFESQPLFGKNLVITRPRHQRSQLASLLSEAGADVSSVPTLSIEPIHQNILTEDMENFDYTHLLFTSVNAVDLFFQAFFKTRDIRDLAGVKIAVIGQKTKERVEKLHLKVDICPDTFIGEAFIDALTLSLKDADTPRFYFPHAAGTRPSLLKALEKLGDLTHHVIYRSVKPKNPVPLPEKIDGILFTSSSTVQNFVEIYGKEPLKHSKIFSIGSITSDTLTSFGFKDPIQSDKATIESLVDAVRSHLCE